MRTLIPFAVLAVLAAAIAASAATAKTSATPIKVAVLSDCQGAFGSFDGQDLAGVVAAMSQYAGAKPVNPNDPRKGWTGGQINGHPLKLVGIGCSNDKADTAIKETKRLMEQLGADVMIGPLSGDESIAVANYAKQHPTKTFVDGSAGAQDTTLKVRAKNFFRFNGDGAMWNAGLGDLAYNKLHWKTAAVVADDYSFAWTSAAGFIAEFCAVGGKVTKRVFPPLNTTDYSSYAQQMPTNVDGTFVAVGGAGLIPFLKAYEQAHGPIDGKKFIGNLFWGTPGQFEQLSTRVVGAYVGGAGTAGDLATPAAKNYANHIIGKWFKTIPPFGAAAPQAASTFTYGYFINTWGLIKGLQAVKGNIGPAARRRFRPRSTRPCCRRRTGRSIWTSTTRASSPSTTSSSTPRAASWRSRRSATSRTSTRRSAARSRHPRRLRGVRARSASSGACRGLARPNTRRSPASDQVAEAAAPEHAEPILRLRGIGRRFGGLHAVRDVDLDVALGERRAILGPNGAGKTTLFNVISGDFPPSSGTIEFQGDEITQLSPSARAKLGMGRTYQKSRLFLGLSVEDNLYLAVLGVKTGHLRPVVLRRDRELRERARDLARTVGLEGRERAIVGSLSHGEQRQLEVGMARAVESDADDARRARLRPVARRACRTHRFAPPARFVDHADPDRARHGCCASRRGARDDDARRPRDRRRHARRDPRQPDRARPLSRQGESERWLSRCSRSKALMRSMAVRKRSKTSRSSSAAGATSIIGRNGMGKTTLCNAIVGVPPARVTGSIRFEGNELVGRPSYKIAKLGIALRAAGPPAFSVTLGRRASADDQRKR